MLRIADRVVGSIAILVVCLAIVGCGGSSSSGGPQPTKVTPASAQVPLGGTQQFTASTPSVAWSLSGAGAVGAITAGGLYTAPTSGTTPANFEVTATPQTGAAGTAPVTIPAVGVSVSPQMAAVVATTQSRQFQATVTGTTQTSVTWSVDGTDGGNAAVGTISATGLYTPPANAGTHAVKATSVADSTKSASATIAITDLSGVFTYHNDVARDGANPQEYGLTASSVKMATFGKLFSCAVDGAAYTQPLWIPSLNVGGNVRNVLFVATQHDSLYALDADASPCHQLWHINLLDAAHGGTAGEVPVPTADVGNGFQDIQPEIGVTGTPVIDPATNTLYVVSKSEGPAGTFHQRLHALDEFTGNEKFSGPVNIAASVAGTGDGSVGGVLTFDPQNQHQRSGLALVNGAVYIAWASHEDRDPYHGWLMSYDASTLTQVAVFNANPDGSRAGIWMGGGAPAVDSFGNLYLSTGNGTFDGNSGTPPDNDFGDSVLKIGTSGLSVDDWFTPFNQNFLNGQDLDVASAGMVVLPDQTSGPPHLLVAGGKEGKLYLLDRDNMGKYCGGCNISDTNILQSFLAAPAIFGTPAFWQNNLYLGGTDDNLRSFAFDSASGLFNTAASSSTSANFSFPGPPPSVSSQGATNGIVWAIDSSRYGVPSSQGSGPALLHAYDAANLATELWNSSQAAGNRDVPGNAVKFTVPTVANGKVYIGTRTEIDVYGLLPN